MKKLMLTLAMVMALIFAVNMESKAQDETPVTVGINAGWSYLHGIVGGELKVGHWSAGGGYTPAGSGSWFVTYSDAIARVSSGYYVSFGQAINGLVDYYGYYYNGMIVMGGYEVNWYNGLNMKGGLGYMWNDGGVFTWELTLGYQFKVK